ncbi:MAG: hypothetical protein ACPGQW_02905, partial [Paracoccaceae bacterium]
AWLGLAWRTRAEDQGDVGLVKISGLKFFKEVAFARGPDARPCCFFAVLNAYLDRPLSRGWLPL